MIPKKSEARNKKGQSRTNPFFQVTGTYTGLLSFLFQVDDENLNPFQPGSLMAGGPSGSVAFFII